MIRTVLASLVFAVLLGIAYRLYAWLRFARDPRRFAVWPVTVASLVGGTGFYLAGQIRQPHVPRLLDVPAFLILAFAAGILILLFEWTGVIVARRAERADRERNARLKEGS